jgi:hypothetical protein
MPIDLVELKRQSKIAAVLTAISSLVVLASLLFGYKQITSAERKVASAEQRIAHLQIEEERLKRETADLTIKKDALSSSINNTIRDTSTPPPNSAKEAARSVSGHAVTISILIAEKRDRSEAEKAAQVLRSRGYDVTDDIKVTPLGESPHETTVRFFQYDRTTVAIGKDLVQLLKGIGFTVRPEFDDEYVGDSSGPPPGTYEVWIGLNPSYNPPQHSP